MTRSTVTTIIIIFGKFGRRWGEFSGGKYIFHDDTWANSHYHTSHFLMGFILEPAGQLNSVANSFKFERGPMTRNFSGQCGSFSTCKPAASEVIAEHQAWKKMGLWKKFY